MLALICGAGHLPSAIAAAAPAPPVVCTLDGFAPEGLRPDLVFRLETLGSLIVWLKARGVTRVCLCGRIRRPDVDPARIDPATAPLAPRLQAALGQGDDGALRIVLALFEEAGLDAVAAHHAAPDLLPPAGVATRARPPDSAEMHAALGDAALARMGAADEGQACVIRNGAVVATEGPDGTDAMLRRLGAGPDEPVGWMMGPADAPQGSAADWVSARGGGAGFLFKGPKPGQDRRADLPVIGPDTVDAVAQAGLSGIVIAAGGVMVLDRARVVAACDRAGLFLWVRERCA